MADLVSLADILAARSRIAHAAVRTPLLEFDRHCLTRAAKAARLSLHGPLPRILLKNEAAQPIGSFKLRGAYNKIAALAECDPEALRRGVITYSSGNHAQGVAFAARAVGIRAIIVMPENAPAVKRLATEALGAEIVTVGPASKERKRKAEELVAQHGYTMVPPYDDPFIIAGQATCGVEILEQLAEQAIDLADTLVLSPVSGGGLLSGVATGIRLASEAAGNVAPPVWGCEPALASDARESFYSGHLVEWAAEQTTRTLADGLRTQSLGELNFEHILRYAGGIATVGEAEIRAATRLILAATDVVAEPSGAVTLAAALFSASGLPNTETVVAIVSGGNLDPGLRLELARETEMLTAAAHV